MKKNPVEILAPAGSFESMKAAVAAGADAVYIGGSRFGARAYADNPGEDQLLEAIDYVHLYGKKLYLTVNTLMKEEEMGELYDYLKPYYERGLDAVIVQDLGVLSFVRKHFPGLAIHASTQMTITGVRGAALLKKMGAERVVTARELSLDEIRKIHNQVDVEIESFVHGALCYCYSGQCLFSSLIGGRSGNRGRCAQTCRLPFDVKRGSRSLNGSDEKYVLSLKDLCTLDLIPQMIEGGIFSMKIEGRMKSPRYTAGVVSIYRKYTDLYLKNGKNGYQVEEKDRKLLLDLFDRGGQTEGYYRQHNGRDMVVWKEKPAFREGNQQLFDYLDKTYVGKIIQLPVSGYLWMEPGQPISLTLVCKETSVTVTGEIVQEAVKQPVSEEKIREQLNKTGNSRFYFDSLEIMTSGSCFLPIQAVNSLRRNGLEQLEQELLIPFRRKALPCGTEEKKVREEKGLWRERGFSVSIEDIKVLPAALECDRVFRIYLDAAEIPSEDWKYAAETCRQAGKECYLTMPHIFRTEAEVFFHQAGENLKEAEFDGFLLRSLEEIKYLKEQGFEKPMVFDFGLYGMNQTAQAVLKDLGASELTWPVELNSRELGRLPVPGELVVYGRLPMMVSAQCIHKGTEQCDKKPEILVLKDRKGAQFPVKNHCAFCYNTIYNGAPLSLLGMGKAVEYLEPSSLRIQFTTESRQEADLVLKAFCREFYEGKESSLPFREFTRGHFKRGVE